MPPGEPLLRAQAPVRGGALLHTGPRGFRARGRPAGSRPLAEGPGDAEPSTRARPESLGEIVPSGTGAPGAGCAPQVARAVSAPRSPAPPAAGALPREGPLGGPWLGRCPRGAVTTLLTKHLYSFESGFLLSPFSPEN